MTVNQSVYSLIGNWLLNHLVLLTFVAFAVVGWLIRDDLFGMEEAIVESSSPINAPVQPSPSPSIEMPKDNAQEKVVEPPAVVEPDASPVSSVGKTNKEEPELAPEPNVPPVVEPVSEPEEVEPEGEFRPIVPEEINTVADPGVTVPPATEQTLPLVAPIDPQPELPISAIEVLPEAKVVDPKEMLQKARGAFWDGDLEVAETHYLKYLALFPEDPNAFGELGNLYQSMGNTEAALNAYVEAGIRLQIAGGKDQLQQIIELLQQAGDPRAAQFKMSESH